MSSVVQKTNINTNIGVLSALSRLKMKAAYYSKTLVYNQKTYGNNQEAHRHENPKSYRCRDKLLQILLYWALLVVSGFEKPGKTTV